VRLSETRLEGLYLVELDLIEDARGAFARSFCREEFEAAGVEFSVAQANISFNRFAGTIRGMHLQKEPRAEAKIVRCTRGALFDVAIDLRPGSDTFCEWYGTELNAENRRALFIPEGFAHGFQTLTDDTEVHYLMSEPYAPEYATGVRFDDSVFGIEWPMDVVSISDKDRSWPSFGREAQKS
jgi:dTDP-4-dehydrorhamnose 3,5-epimerase